METLQYNKRRHLLIIFLCGLCLCFFMVLFLNPSATDTFGGRAAIVSGSLGHMVIVPGFILVLAAAVWRSAVLMVSGPALEVGPDHLAMTTMFGRREIPWSEIQHVVVRVHRSNGNAWHRMSICADRTRKLTLEETDLDPADYDDFIARLQARAHDARMGHSQERSASNAEATIARYLATKADQTVAAPAAPRGFGRKGL